MRTLSFIFIVCLFFASCGKDDEPETTKPSEINYKQEMCDFVIGISQYAKDKHPGFLIVPQNGMELVTSDGNGNGSPDSKYLSAIDANGQEDLFYGYNNDNEATPAADNSYLTGFLDVSLNAGNTILVTDYCSTHSKMDDANAKNAQKGYISFAANHRELNNIPNYPNPIVSENANDITKISDVHNFLYLINPTNYSSKTDFIQAVTATNYDLLIMDLFFTDGSVFSSSEVAQLHAKANGGSRLVICYMSIGEAENYRYYWKSDWNTNKPSWLDAENPDWPGNYKVKYWNTDWQKIIYGNDNSYLKKILDAHFDGVYLDIIDAFDFFS